MMVTLRTYTNSIEAGMAKSILDEHNIFCSLADENANVYGGAPFAMPVRLQVREEQADEALRILQTSAAELTKREAIDEPSEQNSMSNGTSEILDELKRLRSKIENQMAVIVVAALILAGGSLYRAYFSPAGNRARQTETWDSVRRALDHQEYDKAAEIAQRLAKKTPDYYYGYAFLGYIALERNRLKEAEGYFVRAYELFPTDENEQKLQAVRKRLAAENPEVKR